MTLTTDPLQIHRPLFIRDILTAVPAPAPASSSPDLDGSSSSSSTVLTFGNPAFQFKNVRITGLVVDMSIPPTEGETPRHRGGAAKSKTGQTQPQSIII
ncbi:hypothetical protein HK102_012481, partial [Quaeritorhiza haematococci]